MRYNTFGMEVVKKVSPILFALLFVFGVSYYLFSVYEPSGASQVKNVKSTKSSRDYLDTIPMPSGTQEVGRNIREKFSQITASSSKSSQEVQKFFRGVLISKGWKTKDSAEELLSAVYTRDDERIEVSVLSADDERGTVFSISYFD